MSFTITKQQFNGTKLDGSAMPAGIVPATLTGLKDLGMVKISPQYIREGGKTESHQIELIFTGANNTQAKKECGFSIDEKAFLHAVIVAVDGAKPADNYDAETLLGKNITLLTQTKVSRKGKTYTKITAVAPAQPGQQTFTAPTPGVVNAASAVPATSNVGF